MLKDIKTFLKQLTSETVGNLYVKTGENFLAISIINTISVIFTICAINQNLISDDEIEKLIEEQERIVPDNITQVNQDGSYHQT